MRSSKFGAGDWAHPVSRTRERRHPRLAIRSMRLFPGTQLDEDDPGFAGVLSTHVDYALHGGPRRANRMAAEVCLREVKPGFLLEGGIAGIGHFLQGVDAGLGLIGQQAGSAEKEYISRIVRLLFQGA